MNEYSTYQPIYCYIPEKDMVLEYNAMVTDPVYLPNYMDNPKFKFLGWGYMVYTYLDGDDWEIGPYKAGSTMELSAFFKQVI